MSQPEVLNIRRFVVEEIVWESVSVYTLRLKPESGSMFQFLSGQWVYLHLLNADGSSAGRAAFSIASAASESMEMIELGIKVKGDFTKQGGKLQPGDVVGIQGPFGVFVLPSAMVPIVFLGAGIGITPLRSMIHEACAKKWAVPLVLFYSNRYIEDAVYFEEFDDLEKEWPSFHTVCTLTGDDNPSIWKDEVGRIDEAMLKKYGVDFSQSLFYMCGPAGFMESMTQLLEKLGVDIKKQIKRESFT